MFETRRLRITAVPLSHRSSPLQSLTYLLCMYVYESTTTITTAAVPPRLCRCARACVRAMQQAAATNGSTKKNTKKKVESWFSYVLHFPYCVCVNNSAVSILGHGFRRRRISGLFSAAAVY